MPEDSTEKDQARKFETDDLHLLLLQAGDISPVLLPQRIDLSKFYGPRIDEMYETKIQRGEWDDLTIPLGQRLKSPKKIPVYGERGCTAYCDPQKRTVEFSPIVHGDEMRVTSDAFDLIKGKKLPLMGIHTHPVDQFFSPEDFNTILWSPGNRRFEKAGLLLCPSSQVLAIASSETPKYEEHELIERIKEWNQQNNLELDQIAEDLKARDAISDEKLREEIDRLARMATSGKYTPKQFRERADEMLYQESSVDTGALYQKQNQALLAFAISNHIRLYFSTDRRNFSAFTA